MKRAKQAIKPTMGMSVGHLYGESLRLKAKILRSQLLVSDRERQLIAKDLEALAWLAENMPQVFSKIPR